MAVAQTSAALVASDTGNELYTKFNNAIADLAAIIAQSNANQVSVAALPARLGGMIGGYVNPTSNFTYGQASALWNAASVISTLNGAANSAAALPVACFMLAQQTSGGLPIFVVISTSTSNTTSWAVTTYSVSAAGVLTQLATTNNAGTAFTTANIVAVEIDGSNTFRIYGNSSIGYGADVSIAASGAVTISTNTNFRLPFLDLGNPTELRSGSQNAMAQSVGSGSTVIFGYIGTEYVSYAAAQARITAGTTTSSVPRSTIRADSFNNAAGAQPIGWTNLGGGFFVSAAIGQRVTESARLNFYLWFVDDNGPQRLGVFSFNSVPTSIQVSALSNSLVLVKFKTSNGFYMIPLAVNVVAKTFNFAMNNNNQSAVYAGGGGFALPMADTVAYNATSGVMVTKEGSGSTNPNTFAFRPITFDTTQAANPALAETGSPITFQFGQGVDTTGTAYIQLVYRFSSDIVILVGGGGANGGTVSALVVQSMSLAKQ